MAQAPGGLSASQAAASDDGMYCKLCPSVKATAYCLHWQCKVYLCLNCAGHHKILPATASHKLLEGDKFPSFYTTGHGEDVRQCPDHPEEEIKFYCPSHDVLCCRDCNVLNKHDQCTKHYIPEISKEFLESSEYTKLTEEFHSSEDKIKDFFKKIDACLRAVESINTNVVEQFTSYKALIMAYLDQREKELLVELKTIRDRDTAALDELKATAKTIQAEHSEAHAKLRLHEDNSHDLFIATKRVQALMTKLKTSLDDIADKPWYSSVKLWKDPVVEKLLANKEGLAQIISTSDLSTCVFERQKRVNIALTTNANIRDIFIVSPDRILLSNSKGTVKLVDTNDGQLLSEVSVPVTLTDRFLGSSWRLFLTRNDRAAVSHFKKVQFINIQCQSITLGTVLALNYESRDVSTCGENDLVVSYQKAPWLEVISPDGSVRHQFHQIGQTSHFKYPDYLTTSVNGYVYVSDRGTNKITKLDSSLQLLQTFSDPLLNKPRTIISVSPDQILVCSYVYRNNSIVLLNTRTCKSSVLLEECLHGSPLSLISYCPEQYKLYVTRELFLYVYTLSPISYAKPKPLCKCNKCTDLEILSPRWIN